MLNMSNILSIAPNKNILLVYGSFSGSTKEIADSMSKYLTLNSNTVSTLAAEKSKTNLSKYDLIIIGSAIHGDAPHPKILEFIDMNKVELNKKKVAVFVVCGTITSTKKSKRDNALKYPDKVASGLKPISKTVFAGYLAPSKSKFEEFMGKAFLGVVSGDYRDWGKIKKWVLDIP
jgi:menaquinone-dependent protoporphyrinogen oxidase